MANQAVNCPVHGTHGNLSNGKCWYCVQAGMSPTPTVKPSSPGTVRRIG